MPFIMPQDQFARPLTACLALADGSLFWGHGLGKTGLVNAELCFNTAMTGYQEIMTDPSYAGQIVVFTFPHIGNTGVTDEDDEAQYAYAEGMVVKWNPTEPSNWRAKARLNQWLERQGKTGIGGIDTRRLTRLVRAQGAPHCALAYDITGKIDTQALIESARAFGGLENMDLAQNVSTHKPYIWNEDRWQWEKDHHDQQDKSRKDGAPCKVVAIDYGAKRNILRCLYSAGCQVTVMPAQSSADDILKQNPDGIFLSNGPGDPAATGAYSVPMIREILDRTDLPIFGICLGHQMLALALGAKTVKMNHGHHGANHPVKDMQTGKVEITSMNHGFTVDGDSLPDGVKQTHISLFDGTNCGLALTDRPVFSVQYHPEASPGPQDSYYLFEKFSQAMQARRAPSSIG